MKTARVIVSLATAVAVTAGAGTAVAQDTATTTATTTTTTATKPAADTSKRKPSEALGYTREVCDERKDEKGNIIRENCRKLEVKPSDGSAKAFDTAWGVLGSSDAASSKEGDAASSKDGASASSKDGSGQVPAWTIAVAVLGTLAVVGIGILSLFVEDFSIRFF